MPIDSKFGKELSEHFGRFNDSSSNDISFQLPHAEVDFPVLDVNVVSRQFQKVRKGVACGSDGIAWWIFKYFPNELATVYTYIYQESILRSEIPSLWKTALTSPVPKVKIPKCVNDFRPIDLASIAFNSFQKIMLPELMDRVDQIGDNMQFAYRKGVSCIDAVLVLIHDIVSHLNSKETTISKVLFLDFSSAFNTVLPNQLLRDLSTFVDKPWFIYWLEHFLHGWTRKIKLDKGLSELSKIDVGVPQGGPLSAILFTIYTNEIRSNESLSVVKYADDTALSCKISKNSYNRDQISYQQAVNDIVSTCNEKNLLLNPTKSKEMCFANVNIKHEGLLTSKSQSVSIQGSNVERTSHTKYLGVCIDDRLTFSPHVSNVMSKVYFVVSGLAYIVSFFNEAAKESVFKSVILPHLIYAVPVWYHFILQRDKDRIVKFLKFTKKVLHLDYQYMKLTVNAAAKAEFIRMATKIYDDKCHPLHASLRSLNVQSGRSLRNPNILPKYRIQLFKNSFLYRAAVYIQSKTLDDLL